MAVPVAEVVDAEALEEEIEHDLLARRIRAEPYRRARRSGSGADREGHDELVSNLSTGKNATTLVSAVGQTVGDDRAMCALRQQDDGRHQNGTPCRHQAWYATSQAAMSGTSLTAVPRDGSQLRRWMHKLPSL